MPASMRARFLFLPRDLTEQRISELEQLLFLWGWVGRGLLDLIIGIRAGPLHGSGERNREAILAEFFEGDFGDLGETVAIENVRDGVAHIEQEGGRPLYCSSARGTFCLAARALRAARRTWLPACRIPMLSRGLGNSARRTWLPARRIPMLLRGLGNSARRTGMAARGLCMTAVGIRLAARGIGMLARRLRSAVCGSFDLAPRH